MPAKIYYEKDVKENLLDGERIAIIGYGSQGHAHALNLKDSGFEVVLGLKEGGPSWDNALRDGWEPKTVEEAVQNVRWVQILVPDELQGAIYESSIKPYLNNGMVLGFAHGFNIRFELIKPPENVDVVMVAPKGPGHLVRRQYVEEKGVPCIIAVEQNFSSRARELALSYANGIGGTRGGVIETSFKEETETDLFGEQAVLCGGLVELIKAGFETLVEAGYQPEIAYFECLHEVKLITDLIFEGGISNMNHSISNTAEFGEYLSGPRLINKDVKSRMKDILKDIQNGSFANRWIDENRSGRPAFQKSKEANRNHNIEKVGRELRDKIRWLR